jgi:hypothetical protein
VLTVQKQLRVAALAKGQATIKAKVCLLPLTSCLLPFASCLLPLTSCVAILAKGQATIKAASVYLNTFVTPL